MKICRPDHRQDFAVVGVHGYHRAIGSVVGSHSGQLVDHGLLGSRLKIGVKGGINGKARAVDGLGVKLRFQERLDKYHPMREAHSHLVISKVVGLQFVSRSHGLHRIHADRVTLLPDRYAVFLAADVIHEYQYRFGALQGHVAIIVNVISSRRLRQAGQKCRLPERQVRSGSIEIRFSCGLYAVAQVAIKNFIQVKLQHLVFGIAPGNFRRQDDLTRLPLVALLKTFIRQQDHARQLLGNGRTA